jgi:hypothetical protein
MCGLFRPPTGNVWLPLQGRDGKRRTLARADPAGRGQLERTIERIRLAAVSYDQRHILIDRSGVNRFLAKSFREHTHSLPQYPGRRAAYALPRRGSPAINGNCSFRVHILRFAIGWACSSTRPPTFAPLQAPPRDRGPHIRARQAPQNVRRPQPVPCGKAGARPQNPRDHHQSHNSRRRTFPIG